MPPASGTPESITVTDASQFAGYSTPFVIQIGSEEMNVTAVSGTIWTVTRGYGSTTPATHSVGAIVGGTTLTVAGTSGFAIGPSSSFVIQVDSEEMLVTKSPGTTWSVTRGYNGTAVAAHATQAAVVSVPTTTALTTAICDTTIADDTTTLAAAVTSTTATTITVDSPSEFPLASGFAIWVDKGTASEEEMLVTGHDPNDSSVWYVTRGYGSTTPATHSAGAAVSHGSATIASSDTTIVVADPTQFQSQLAQLSSSGAVFAIQVDDELMVVTAYDPSDPSVWQVTRYAPTTHAVGAAVEQAEITVAANSAFPTTGEFVIQVGSEQMLVTNVFGGITADTWIWIVTRGYNHTAAVAHASSTAVVSVPTTTVVSSAETTVASIAETAVVSIADTTLAQAILDAPAQGTKESITVTDASQFVGYSTGFVIQVDSEEMYVAGPVTGTTWTVTRGYNGTTTATHTSGAIVGDTTITVADASSFPSSAGFAIWVDDEEMYVTAMSGATWTVTRGYNGTAVATHATGAAVSGPTITVADASSFPSSAGFAIWVNDEEMYVTAMSGATWTVTRGYNGTTAATHATGAVVSGPTITVADASSFPSSAGFVIQVDDEQMYVTAMSGTTWTVTRAYNDTTAAAHAAGAVASVTDATAGVQETSEPNSQAVASNANGDYVTVWSIAPGQNLTFVLSSPIGAGYFALVFNGTTSSDVYFDPDNLTQTAANIQAALVAIESGTTVAYDAVDSDAVAGRFVFDVTFATASPVLNRPLITEQGPASITATQLAATMRGKQSQCRHLCHALRRQLDRHDDGQR